MHQSMSLELSQLQLTGGVTTTIFPAVEQLINETDYQLSLEFVASRKNMQRYRSMVDFLFCEVFVQYRAGCFRYYQDETKHPLLKNILTPDEVTRYERWMVAALQLAREKFENKRKESWTQFRIQALKLAA